MTGAATPPLRVVFLTSGGVHGAAVLEQLLSTPAIELAGIVQSTRVMRAGQGPISAVQQIVRQCGWRYAIYLWLSTWFADAALGMLSGRSVSAQARRRKIPLFQTGRINASESATWVRERRPQLIVSAFFNQRVGDSVVGLASSGAVNIHPGPLPALKGVDPVFFGMLRGLPEAGTTVHRITNEFDSGPVLAIETVPTRQDSSALCSTLVRYQRGAAMLQDLLGDITAAVSGSPQSESGNYDSWPSSEQVRDFRARGLKLVNRRDVVALLTGHLPAESR